MTAGTLTDRPREQAAGNPRRAQRPAALLTVSYLVAAVLALPLVFLLVEAQGAGTADVAHLIFRSLTGTLLWNTVRLAVVVTVACAVLEVFSLGGTLLAAMLAWMAAKRDTRLIGITPAMREGSGMVRFFPLRGGGPHGRPAAR